MELEKILLKMVESFKTKNKRNEFLISLFTMMRILMLRLSPSKLSKATNKVWPHLQAELVAVFEDC